MIPKQETAGTQNRMVLDGRSWYLPQAERPLLGYSLGPSEAQRYLPTAFEGIGLVPCWIGDAAENQFRVPAPHFQGFDGAAYETKSVGQRSEITATFDSGRSRLTWTFDARYGNLPVRAELTREDQPLYRSETSYEKIDQRWAPSGVEFFRGDSNSPYKSVEVVKATFDEPWHRKEFTPEDIGVLPGTQFYSSIGIEFWTGLDLMDHEDFWPLVYADPELIHPRVAELLVEGTDRTVEEYREYLRQSGENWRRRYKKEHGFDPWEDEATSPKSEDKDP